MEHSSYKIKNLCEIAIFVKELTHNFIRVNLRFIVDNKSCSYHVYCVLVSNLIGSFLYYYMQGSCTDFTISCGL